MNKKIRLLAKRYWYLEVIWILVLTPLFIMFVLPLLLPVSHLKDAKISGFIFNDQVWEGKIEIVGDVIALPNTEIVIKSGTEIKIKKSGDTNNFYIHPRMVKSGINTGERDKDVDHGEPFWDEKEKIQVRFNKLIAEGTEDFPITFRSDDNPGSRYDINLISFKKGVLRFTRLSNYRRMEVGSNVIIEKNDFSTTGECAICLERGEQKIKGNTFKNGYNFYILANESSALIENNIFLPGEGQGIHFSGNDSSVIQVKKNFFDIQGRDALVIRSFDEGGFISENLFNSGNIVLPCFSKVEIFNNIIKTQVIFKDSGNCKGVYTIGSNYWEILNAQDIIKARIVNTHPNFEVITPFFLKNPPEQVFKSN